MADKKFDESEGVWRTIGGRRVFIRTGQSLTDAMKESGKFKTATRHEVQQAKAEKKIEQLGKENEEIWKKTNKFDDSWYDENGKLTKEGENLYNKREKNAEEIKTLEQFNRDYEPRVWEDDRYNNPIEYKGDISDLEGKHIKGQNVNTEPVEDRLVNNMIVSHYGSDVAYRDAKNNLWVTSREQYNDYVNGKKDKIGGELVANDDEALKTMISNEGLNKYPYEGYVRDEKTGNDKKYKEFVDSEYNRLKDKVEDSTNARVERAKTNENYSKFREDSNENIRIEDKNGELTGYTDGERIEYSHSGSTGLMANVYSTDDGKLSGQYFEIPKEYQGDKLKDYSLKEIERLKSDKEAYETRQKEGMDKFIQKVDMHGGTREYTKEDLDRMKEAGIQPMEHSYTGGGWEGVNSNLRMDTKDQAKAITDAMKDQYPDVKISRKTNLFSGGSSIDFNIMSSDKDLFVSNNDIDKMGYSELHDVSSSNGFEWWAKDNVKGYNENRSYNIDDVRKYAKESLAKRKESDIQSVRGNEWYLNDYGKKVVSELNKQANSYTYNDSDGMVDYFDHGTYMHISIGKWNKPYQVNETTKKASSKQSSSDVMNNAIRNNAKKGGFYTRKDGTKEYDPYKGTPYEKKYDSMQDVINDPNSKLNQYMNEKIQKKAYKKYLKEHPASKMSFEEFKKEK